MEIEYGEDGQFLRFICCETCGYDVDCTCDLDNDDPIDESLDDYVG